MNGLREMNVTEALMELVSQINLEIANDVGWSPLSSWSVQTDKRLEHQTLVLMTPHFRKLTLGVMGFNVFKCTPDACDHEEVHFTSLEDPASFDIIKGWVDAFIDP